MDPIPNDPRYVAAWRRYRRWYSVTLILFLAFVPFGFLSLQCREWLGIRSEWFTAAALVVAVGLSSGPKLVALALVGKPPGIGKRAAGKAEITW